MQLISFLQTSPLFFVLVCFIFGLIVGSFLNVVIYRVPVMLERRWRAECEEMLNGEAQQQTETFNLITPQSRCPHCNNRIRAWQNIPVVSYLFLKGRCANCKQGISLRYPMVELLTGVVSALVAWHFGWGWQAFTALFLTWALLAMTFIDFDHQLLPDNITLPFLWLGLLVNVWHTHASLAAAVIGAIAGYLSLWSIYQLFKLATGKEGMGYGDFKLLALLGAWLGWQMLPMIILLSSLVGAVLGISLIIFGRHARENPMPFGPFLAIAGWIALIWGEPILRLWYGYLGAG